jgi:hypothetical protein
VWSCTSAHTRHVGRFFHSSALALGKRAVPRPSAPGTEGYARGVSVSSTVPGRARGSNKAVAFHNPQALSNVQEENRSCARDQMAVAVARPPVLTPPWRYRRSRRNRQLDPKCAGEDPAPDPPRAHPGPSTPGPTPGPAGTSGRPRNHPRTHPGPTPDLRQRI